MIWFKKYTPEEIRAFITHDSIVDLIGIEFLEIGPAFLKARMPTATCTAAQPPFWPKPSAASPR